MTGVGTREAILDFVRRSGRPVRVADVCDAFGLNHTGVRRHLANLRDAGLVTQRVAPPAGRGRPTLEYEATPHGDSEGSAAADGVAAAAERGQGDLVRMLLEMVTTGQDARVVGRRAGRQLADAAVEGPRPGDVLDAVAGAARQMGFAPVRRLGPGGVDEIVLQRCPFADGALLAPEVVCELHLGMAEGVAAAMGSDARLSFAFADPRRAGCRLVVQGVPIRAGS